MFELPDRFLTMGYSFKVFFDVGALNGIKEDRTLSLSTGASLAQSTIFDTMFQSVSGLSVSFATEKVDEHGENNLEHTLPTKATYQNLVLTRGLAPSSAVTRWMHEATENFNFIPAQVTIILMGTDQMPVHAWFVKNAYPMSWSVDGFNAEESKIVIEKMELKYDSFKTLNADDLAAPFL